MIDEERTRPHERIAGPELGEIGPGLGPAVVDRLEQRGIQPPQAGQGLGIHPITLAVAAIDESQLARVGHQHLVPEAPEQPAHPR